MNTALNNQDLLARAQRLLQGIQAAHTLDDATHAEVAALVDALNKASGPNARIQLAVSESPAADLDCRANSDGTWLRIHGAVAAIYAEVRRPSRPADAPFALKVNWGTSGSVDADSAEVFADNLAQIICRGRAVCEASNRRLRGC